MVGWEKSQAEGVKMNRKSSNTAFWNLSRDIWVKGIIRQSSLYANSVQKKNILVPFYISRAFLLLVREKLGKWCCATPQLSKSWWLFCPLGSRENCWDLARSWWSHEQSPGTCEHLWCIASLRGLSLKSHLTPKGEIASGTQWMGRKLYA